VVPQPQQDGVAVVVPLDQDGGVVVPAADDIDVGLVVVQGEGSVLAEEQVEHTTDVNDLRPSWPTPSADP
jgi:hypothetical protein